MTDDVTDEQQRFAEEAAQQRDIVSQESPGFGTITLPFDALKDILGMPADMSIAAVIVDHTRRTVSLTVISPDLPLVPEGDQVPDVQVLNRIRIIRVEPQFIIRKNG